MMYDAIYEWPDLDEMLKYFIPAVDKLGLRLLDISCADADYFQTSGRIIRKVRSMWPHFMMGGASRSYEQADERNDQRNALCFILSDTVVKLMRSGRISENDFSFI